MGEVLEDDLVALQVQQVDDDAQLLLLAYLGVVGGDVVAVVDRDVDVLEVFHPQEQLLPLLLDPEDGFVLLLVDQVGLLILE